MNSTGNEKKKGFQKKDRYPKQVEKTVAEGGGVQKKKQ